MKHWKVNVMQAILAINPTAKVTVRNDTSELNGLEGINDCTIEWLDGTTPISKADIKVKLLELDAEYDAQDYARKRKVAYPDIYDYMDGIVKNDQTQINKYIADSQAVKVRYPKGA